MSTLFFPEFPPDGNPWEIERVDGGHSGGSTPDFDWITDDDGELRPTQGSIDPTELGCHFELP